MQTQMQYGVGLSGVDWVDIKVDRCYGLNIFILKALMNATKRRFPDMANMLSTVSLKSNAKTGVVIYFDAVL